MKFNMDKCKLLHLERNNLLQWKLLGSTGLGSRSAEKDPGILVDRGLALAAKAASSMVDSMNRSTGPAGRVESSSSFTQHSLDHIYNTASSFRDPRTKKPPWSTGARSALVEHQDGRGGQGKREDLFSLENLWLQGT